MIKRLSSCKKLPLSQKNKKIKDKFGSLFHTDVPIISRTPGRAEIIGNHTDYNYGFALGAAIGEYTYAAVSLRKDNKIRTYSENIDNKIITFSLSEISKKNGSHWTNHVKAVIGELYKYKKFGQGFNLYITSSVPFSGGVSSSAALELSVGLALAKLYKIKLSNMDLALLCQKAENGPLVNSPCGFLDQATCSLAKRSNLLFLDFLPKNNLPVSQVKNIPVNLKKYGLSFIIIVDKKVRRNLGESGYPIRRKQCGQSLPVLSKLLKKKVRSLRDVSVEEFKSCKDKLNKIGVTMRKRVEHIIYENQRVLDAVIALKNDNMDIFGKLLTASGKSALELYELDEKTPELTFLLSRASQMKGVIGTRNMGGGFSANILALVKNSLLNSYMVKLDAEYKAKYNTNLLFIPFRPDQGAQVYEV